MSIRRRWPRGLLQTSGEMAATYSPDGLTFEAITDLQRDVEHELHRERRVEPTSWMSLSDTERQRIRPSLRQPETTADSQGRHARDTT